MKKKRLPFIYRMIQGAIGKRFVIKHYSYGIIMTRYPNMKNIMPSEKQKLRRRLFRKAVQYAQSIYADPILREKKRRMLRRPKRLFQALMKEWFTKRKEKLFWNERRITIWKRNWNMHKPSFTISRPVSLCLNIPSNYRVQELLLE
ncbi:MAG TPA: hypothetical protein VGD26_13530 [Chitinophagaceae bacterium]